MTQHPSPRAAIENLWDRATPVEPLLDAYRDQVLTEAAELAIATPSGHSLCHKDTAAHILAARTAQTPQET